jgi:predicted metal-dependent peptidase
MNELRMEMVFDDIRFIVVIGDDCGFIDISSDTFSDDEIDAMMGELEPIIAQIVDNVKFMVTNDLEVRLSAERKSILGQD